MKTVPARKLFAYWNERRGTRLAPERSEIEPGAIRAILGDSFIITFDPVAEHPFRLAGTRVCAMFGHELKGTPFGQLWDEASRTHIRELASIVASEAVPIVAGVAAQTAQGLRTDLELLLLPLYHRGQTHVRLLGVLAPLTVPYWLGAERIVTLTLGTTRHLGPAVEALSAPRLVRGQPEGRPRRGLTVYDGGRD